MNDVSDFKDAVEVITKKLNESEDIDLTRDKMKELTDLLEETGNDEGLIRTSTHLNIKYTQDVSGEIGVYVWSLAPFVRGDKIDESINKHSTGMGLGKTFPVVDRLEDRTVVSTKSVDLGLRSYHQGWYLNYALNRNAEPLITFEEKYFENNGKMKNKYGNKLDLSMFNNKAIEIVVPDMIINQNTLNVLIDFRNMLMLEGINVWFVIAV